MPGDPTLVVIEPLMTAEARARLVERFGLDRPLYEQYFIYLRNFLVGDFGDSFRWKEPVFATIARKIPNTLFLTASSVSFAYLLAVMLGFIAARRRGQKWDQILIVGSLVLRAAPVFWTGVLAIMLFSVNLGWLPFRGIREIGYEATSFFDKYFNLDFLRHLILPTITLGLFYLASPFLVMRNRLTEVMEEDFVTLIRAKGLSEFKVTRRAARNAILPVVTMLGTMIGVSMAGQAVVEEVFTWPGIGRELVSAIGKRDYPVMQAIFFLVALSIVTINFIVDLTYAYLDPRIGEG